MKTTPAQLRAAKRYRERQAAQGMAYKPINIREATHRLLTDKQRELGLGSMDATILALLAD